jgi:deoxyribose-phosphate aldolase
MKKELETYIDYALLHPYITESYIKKFCNWVKRHNFACVCVNPIWVKLCATMLKNSTIKVCATVGFPLGASRPEIKEYEAILAKKDGAREIDMVINIGMLKSKKYDFVEDEIRRVVKIAGKEIPVKVILEACYLSRTEKIVGCKLARSAGAKFVKTSTGFGKGGATLKDVRLFKKIVGKDMYVKAAGGIRTTSQLLRFLQAGAGRIGTSKIIPDKR